MKGALFVLHATCRKAYPVLIYDAMFCSRVGERYIR